jgi:regulator of replication initiation timing
MLVVATCCTLSGAQQTAPESPDKALVDSVQELRSQVQELRTAVAEIRTEASQYRAESEELRREIDSLRRAAPATGTAASSQAAAGTQPAAAPANLPQRPSTDEETIQLLQNEIRTQYQTKIESGSKYRVRLSGLALVNLFSDHGSTDNADFPTYAAPTDRYGSRSSFGATLRQSELGLEVFGPQVGGAKTSGQIQFDFGGGFPAGALDGVNTGLVRMRTADVRFDWEHTSIIAGQDSLFISPLSPTSFASLVIPSFGYTGNLWAWTPQVRVEHRFDLSGDQNLTIQAGIMDNVTGERSFGTRREPQAGESSGQPAYAVRTSWNRLHDGRPFGIGASGYYSRQNWGYGWTVDGWAVGTDWRIPLPSRFELSGEFYRGRAVGGLGGGIGQSILFSGNPLDPASDFRPVDSAGGWSQLKFSATSRLEFNGAFGVDSPFASSIHAFASPVSYYPSVLAANRSDMVNFIYRPRSDLLFSGEYRHLRTTHVGSLDTADQVNMMMGVLF